MSYRDLEIKVLVGSSLVDLVVHCICNYFEATSLEVVLSDFIFCAFFSEVHGSHSVINEEFSLKRC